MDADSDSGSETSRKSPRIEDVSTIAVLGAGTMGHGIAEVAALAGYDVALRDIDDDLVERGYEAIEWSLGKLVEKGRVSREEADAALDRITPLVDLEPAVDEADVVVEVVPERMDIKKDVYAAVEEHAPDQAVFVTNTSALSITELGRETTRSDRFCGMHFFNPPVRMQLVEVISGADTAEETLELVEALAERLGKTPVRVRTDSPGFVVNRVLVPLLNEAAWVVHDGEATVAEVDSTARYGLGLPMGCFELADQVGIDVVVDVLDYMHDERGDAYEPCPLLESTVEAGDLGKKSGAGFYDYDGSGGDGFDDSDGSDSSEASGANGEDGERGERGENGDSDGKEASAESPTGQVDDDLRGRLLAVMATEVAGLVAEGVADVEAIDRAMKLGAGFPEGPAKLADDAGIGSLVDHLDALADETGAARYVVADRLRDLADEGGRFHATVDGDPLAYDTLDVACRERVGRIALDRPHRMNSIDADLLDELDDAITRLEDNDAVRSILLTGAGDRAFSTGADLQRLAADLDSLSAVELSRRGQRTFGRLESSPLPVVAAIGGFCLGGGMELATCADLRIASRRATFALPEHNLGLMPGWGGTQRLRHVVGEGRAKEIILTAERFDAETMADYGFVTEVVGPDALDDRAFELARDLADGPPVAQALTKRAMLRGRDDTEAGLEAEAQAFGHVFGTDDAREGLDAFDSERDPEFVGE